MDHVSANKIYLFQIAPEDLGGLWIDLLHLTWNNLSPISPELDVYQPGTGVRNAELEKLAQNPQAALAAKLIAQPDLRLHFWTGGGITAISFLTLCRNRVEDPNGVVVIAPSYKRSLMIHYFTSVESCAAWLGDHLGSKVEEEPPVLFPPTLPFESALYALHTIDCFRRTAYQSMLEHKVLETPYLTVPQYTSAFNQSLRSEDIRWLLPAFMQMTPDIQTATFKPETAHLNEIVDAKLLRPIRIGGDTGQPAYAFGEAGRLLGIEFMRTWWTAAAFKLELMTGGLLSDAHCAFMAPTAIANHWFSVHKDDERITIQSDALTSKALSLRLSELLLTPVPETLVTPRFCTSCGKPIQTGARFCNYCGQPVA